MMGEIIAIIIVVGSSLIGLSLVGFFLINFTPIGRLGRKLPYYPRTLNWAWAHLGGYYWIPCPICHKKFGGHEKNGSLMDTWSSGRTVCRNCIDLANKVNEQNMEKWQPQINEYYSQAYRAMYGKGVTHGKDDSNGDTTNK